jgi:hypothetical protein
LLFTSLPLFFFYCSRNLRDLEDTRYLGCFWGWQ